MKLRATMPIRIGEEVYPSAQEAAAAVGRARCTVYWHLSRGTLDRIASGFRDPLKNRRPTPEETHD